MMISIQGRPPAEEGIRAIHAALESGCTLIDTADVYCLDENDIGHNERLVARALEEWGAGRDHVTVATKGGVTRTQGRWERNGTREHLYRACDGSLKALGIECLDLYQLHAPDPRVAFEESVGAMADLQQMGKIRSVGLSNVTIEEIEKARRIVPIVTVQNRLSPFFREAITGGVVAHCVNHGIGFLAYSPVGGLRLNGKLPRHPVLAPIAQRLGASAHAVAIAWVLAQGPTVIPIPAGRSPEHVRDAMSAGEIVLSPEDIKAIDEASFEPR